MVIFHIFYLVTWFSITYFLFSYGRASLIRLVHPVTPFNVEWKCIILPQGTAIFVRSLNVHQHEIAFSHTCEWMTLASWAHLVMEKTKTSLYKKSAVPQFRLLSIILHVIRSHNIELGHRVWKLSNFTQGTAFCI